MKSRKKMKCRRKNGKEVHTVSAVWADFQGVRRAEYLRLENMYEE